MPVQQHVLNWLYSVLTSEYHDVNRTYNDVARVLNRFATLAPRTDVHTFPDGSSGLLLHVSGTLPVIFRGSTYRFPLSIWMPHAYPREPPLVYVTPTESMMVRPGQHVDPQGQVYHPYLMRWADFWDKSALEDFLAVLTDVFSKEPPVVSRQAPRPAPVAQGPTPPPVPPLPPEMTQRQSMASPHAPSEPRPPPPPPKPQADADAGSAVPSSPPPPPPPSGAPTQPWIPSRYESAPRLPPPQAHALGPAQPQPHGHPSPQHMSHSPMAHPPPASPASTQSQQPWYTPHHGAAYPPQAQWPPQGPPPWWNEAPVATAQAQAAPPPPNILDEPLTLEIPTTSAVAAPPIPPNPEKDALLRQLAQTLASLRQQSRQQSETSMAGLRAQRAAMQAAAAALQSETGQLTQLSKMLTSNAAVLHEALHKADGVIEGSKTQPAADIDELLVAPTVVSNQLYTLVAEERALGDAIFMLGRAVERGRISPAVFAKMTRSLAREWYLKKALVRKIGEGMGMVLWADGRGVMSDSRGRGGGCGRPGEGARRRLGAGRPWQQQGAAGEGEDGAGASGANGDAW